MSYENPRIKSLNMSTMDVLITLAEGNPGALTVLMRLLENGKQIDPDSALGGMGSLFSLDNLDCYGSRIWMLFKDVCGQDITKMIAVLRAEQLGLVSGGEINGAIDRAAKINPDDLLLAVQEKLPAFGRVAA